MSFLTSPIVLPCSITGRSWSPEPYTKSERTKRYKKRMQGESKALLRVDKVNTYYGKTHILNDVSLELNKQETIALLGRNGFGKSTTLKSIMGLVPPQNGSICF